MAQIPELRGQFTVGSANNGMNVAATALTLTSGTKYTVAAGDESNGLIDDVQTKIRTVEGHGNANVTYSTTTGRITIALNVAATLNMESSLAAALGFASTDYEASATHVGGMCPMHIWRPTRGLSDHPVDVNTFWQPRSSTVAGRAPDGTTYSRAGTKVYDAVIAFDKLPEADVVTPGSGTIRRDLQAWYEAVPCEGMPIRVYPDRTATANSDHWREGIWYEDDAEELGAFEDYASRHLQRWMSLWDVRIPLMKKV